VFLRGMNDEKGGKDPDKRGVGSYQEDDIVAHRHSIRTAGIWHRSFQGENGAPKTAYAKDDSTGPCGDREIRPKNVAVYFYIKIN